MRQQCLFLSRKIRETIHILHLQYIPKVVWTRVSSAGNFVVHKLLVILLQDVD